MARNINGVVNGDVTHTKEQITISFIAISLYFRPIGNSVLEFRVQILASQNRIPVNAAVFKGYKSFEEFREGGFYKYLSAPKSTYSESNAVRQQLIKSFPGAFIVASKNGIRIPLKEAIEEDKKNH